MNVCIVNPPVEKVIEKVYDTPDFPRAALAFLAGYLRENSDLAKVRVIDCKFDRLDFDQCVKKIEDLEIKILALTAMTNEIKSAAKVAKLIKEINPKTITIVGGQHLSALPEETLREFPQFDYGIVGEAETSFLEFVEAVAKSDLTHFYNIKGLCFLEEDQFVNGGASVMLADQEGLNPAWDMFRSAQSYYIQSSRGCPFECNFCINPGGRVVRPRSVEKTLDEIGELIENHGPKTINFGDEIFTVKRQRTLDICQGLIKRGYHKKINWWCQTHVNTLDDEMVKLMKASNCLMVGLGIETGDEITMKNMGKGITLDKVKNAIFILDKYSLKYNTYFILGQPYETVKSAKNTINFAVEINPYLPIFGLMVPYPGTKVWDMAISGEGNYKLKSKDWDAFNKQIGDALELTGISRNRLERIQFFGYLKVFLYNLRLIDLVGFVWKYKTEGFTLIKKFINNFIIDIKYKLITVT